MKTLIILLLSLPALCFGQVLSLSDPNWAAARAHGVVVAESMTMTNIVGAETNCIAWYRGDGYNGTDGTWTNWSATAGINATNLGAATTKPTAVADVLNGKPGVYFDGGDHLQSTLFTNTQPTDVWIVGSVTNAGTGFVFDSASSASRHFFLVNAGQLQIGADTALAGFGVWTNKYMVFRLTYNGGSGAIRTNNVQMVTGNVGTENMDGVVIGANNARAISGISSILEIAFFNKVLESVAASNVNYVLTNRYAIAQ